MKNTLTIIGFDGLSPWLLTQLDEFSTFKAFVESGAVGPMETVDPPFTPPAWSSLYTGAQPERAGITNILKKDGGAFTFLDIVMPKIWDYLADEGLSCGCFCLPLTFALPRKQYKGFMVPGFLAIKRDEAEMADFYPDDFADILSGYTYGGRFHPRPGARMVAQGFRHASEGYTKMWNMGRNDLMRMDYIDFLDDLMRDQWERAKRCFERIPCDVAFVQFSMTDFGGHYVWDSVKCRTELYRRADTYLREIMGFFDSGWYALCSDHGMGLPGEPDTDRFYKNPWYVKAQEQRRAMQYAIPVAGHASHGVFGVTGDGVAQGRRIQSHITDVTPTLLSLFGITSARFDGRVRHECFSDADYTETEQEAVKEQLRALGYIE